MLHGTPLKRHSINFIYECHACVMNVPVCVHGGVGPGEMVAVFLWEKIDRVKTAPHCN